MRKALYFDDSLRKGSYDRGPECSETPLCASAQCVSVLCRISGDLLDEIRLSSDLTMYARDLLALTLSLGVCRAFTRDRRGHHLRPV